MFLYIPIDRQSFCVLIYILFKPCLAVCLDRGYGLLGKLGCLALRQARWGNDENTLGFARVIEEGTFPGKDSR